MSPYSLNCVENDPWSILNANPTSQSLNSINTRASQNLTEQCYILPKPCIVSILATDSAIELFTFIFIEQNSATQEATIDLFTKLVRNNKGSQSRRNTLCLNLLTAILRVLIVLMNKKIDFKGANVAIQIREFAIVFHQLI